MHTICLIFASSQTPVDLDISVIIQVVIFFLLLFILTFILYRPLLTIFEARYKNTEGLKEEAKDITLKAAQIEKEYQEILKKEKREMEKFLADFRQKIKNDENEIIENAKAGAAQLAMSATAQLKEAQITLKKELMSHVEEMAQSLAEKLLKMN